MLIILATLIFWIPSVFGYGIAVALIQRKLSPNQQTNVLAEAIGGMLLVSTLVNLIHFFHEVDYRISFTLTFVGWLLCFFRFRMMKERISFGALSLLVIWIVFLAFWSTQYPRNPDAALYHLQSIKWINLNQLPLGLGNLHDRLAFNSNWFSFAAALQLPLNTAEGGNALSASAFMTFFLGVAIFQSIRQLKTTGNRQIHHVFLSIAPLIALSDLTRRTISSPSPDYAILVLSIAVTYFALEVLVTSQDWAGHLFHISMIVLFALLIKPTAFPLSFLLFGMIAVAWKRKIPISWKRVLGYTLLLAVVPIPVWFARSICLSGYLNYPNSITSFQGLTWMVPNSIADKTWLYTQTTVRPEEAHVSQWIGPWFLNIVNSSDFILCSILFLAGLLLLCFRREPPQKDILPIFIPLSAAILCWFLISADIRFGAGYLWAISLMTLTAGISAISSAKTGRVIFVIFLTCLASFIPRAYAINFGLPPVRKAFRNPAQFFLHLPMIPEAKTAAARSSNGVTIYMPDDGTYNCWLSDLPCTPFLQQNLVAVTEPDGSFTMFYIRQ